MKVLLALAGGFVGFVALFLWAGYMGLSVPVAQAEVPVSVNSQVTMSGIVLMDRSYTNTPTPYLLYDTQSHQFETKVLQFGSGASCDIQAGDLPCEQGNTRSVPVVNGEFVTVKGALLDQHLLVATVSDTSSGSSTMAVVTAGVGADTNTGDMLVTVTHIRAKQDCTLYVGCVGHLTPVVTFHIHDKQGVGRTFALAPGQIMATSFGAIALVSSSANNRTASYVVARASAQ